MRTGHYVCYDTEIDLLRGFENLINKFDPDVITGYNTDGFDLPYIFERIKILSKISDIGKTGKDSKDCFFKFSRLRDINCTAQAKVF